MENIRAFIRISDDFSCSGQPTAQDFTDVHSGGVSTVVNLAMPDSEHALSEERSLVESFGMDYVPIPVPFKAPAFEHFLRFERELLVRQGQRVLVHCALNWRASSFAALFAERHFGWNRKRAEDLRHALWSPNQVWNEWTETVRALPLGARSF